MARLGGTTSPLLLVVFTVVDIAQDEIDLGSLLGGPDIYVLKVAGASMSAAGILDGDLVFLRRQERRGTSCSRHESPFL